MTLKEAIKIIVIDESLADMIYHVRDIASENRDEEDKYTPRWELPRVKAFAEAVKVLEACLKEQE